MEWQRLVLDGRPEAAGWEAAFEFQVPLRADRQRRLSLAATVDLASPPTWYGRSGRRSRGQLMWLDLQRRLGAALALDVRGDGVPCLGWEILAGLGERCAVGCRADPVTGSIGPSTVWRLSNVLLRTSHTAHPDLGVTHRFEVTFGRPEPSR